VVIPVRRFFCYAVDGNHGEPLYLGQYSLHWRFIGGVLVFPRSFFWCASTSLGGSVVFVRYISFAQGRQDPRCEYRFCESKATQAFCEYELPCAISESEITSYYLPLLTTTIQQDSVIVVPYLGNCAVCVGVCGTGRWGLSHPVTI
jgi:hypothetical protein